MGEERLDLETQVTAIEDCPSEDFARLVEASGLDPMTAFRFVKLAAQDFRGADLSSFDFTGADLVGSKFAGARLGQVTFNRAQVRIEDLEQASDWAEQRVRILKALDAPLAEDSASDVQHEEGVLRFALIGLPLALAEIVSEELRKRGATPFIPVHDPLTGPIAAVATEEIQTANGVIVLRRVEGARFSFWSDECDWKDALFDQVLRRARALMCVSVGMEGAFEPEPPPVAKHERAVLQDFRVASYEEATALMAPASALFLEYLKGDSGAALTMPQPAVLAADRIYPAQIPELDAKEITRFETGLADAGLSNARIVEFGRLMAMRTAIGPQGEIAPLDRAAHDIGAWRVANDAGLAYRGPDFREALMAAALEEAACLMTLATVKHALAAEKVLGALRAGERTEPVRLFRLAQVNAFLWRNGQRVGPNPAHAIDALLTRCAQALGKVIDRSWDGEPEQELLALRSVLPSVRAYHLWNMSQEAAHRHEWRLLEKAGDLLSGSTPQGTGTPRQWRMAQNELLYAAGALHSAQIAGEYSYAIEGLTKRVEKCLEKVGPRKSHGDGSFWDTITFARLLLGRNAKGSAIHFVRRMNAPGAGPVAHEAPWERDDAWRRNLSALRVWMPRKAWLKT
jgi:hypothetical protein